MKASRPSHVADEDTARVADPAAEERARRIPIYAQRITSGMALFEESVRVHLRLGAHSKQCLACVNRWRRARAR